MVENSELRKAGLKVTLPRVKILQMLDSAEQRHMSAEDVYKALMEAGEDVGLATVYRVLTQFEAAGLVVRHNFDGGHAVFELADGGHHDHMVNVDSGEVIEFCDPRIQTIKKTIEEILANISKLAPAVRNNGGGHFNHSLFWTVLGPNKGGEPTGDLAKAINETFGSFAELKTASLAPSIG